MRQQKINDETCKLANEICRTRRDAIADTARHVATLSPAQRLSRFQYSLVGPMVDPLDGFNGVIERRGQGQSLDLRRKAFLYMVYLAVNYDLRLDQLRKDGYTDAQIAPTPAHQHELQRLLSGELGHKILSLLDETQNGEPYILKPGEDKGIIAGKIEFLRLLSPVRSNGAKPLKVLGRGGPGEAAA